MIHLTCIVLIYKDDAHTYVVFSYTCPIPPKIDVSSRKIFWWTQRLRRRLVVIVLFRVLQIVLSLFRSECWSHSSLSPQYKAAEEAEVVLETQKLCTEEN